MNRVFNIDNDYLEVPRSRIDQVNSDIKKTSLFSHYIWTHSIHVVEKCENKYKTSPKPEEPKLGTVKSQPNLIERNHSTANTKKTDEEEERKGRKNNKKGNSMGKLNLNFEQVDKLVGQNKPNYVVREKVDEIIRDAKSVRKNDLNKFQDMYYELFSSTNELQHSTLKKNQEFTEKISTIQQELRPEMSKLPALYSESAFKIGFKTKPAKMSIEPTFISSVRGKISMLKEIENKHKFNTNREKMQKIPFSVTAI